MARGRAPGLDHFDGRFDGTAALVSHDQHEWGLERIASELEAAEHHTIVEHLSAGTDDGQIASVPIEDELRWQP